MGSGYWHLRKGLYGLRQSGRQWYLDLNSKLESVGFRCIEPDWSVHIRRSLKAQTIAATNVDDMFLSSTAMAESDSVVADISKHYNITDNCDVNFHLGCTIICWWTRGTIKVHKEAFTASILHDAGMNNSKPVSAPMNPGIRLTSDMCPTMDVEKTRVRALFPYCIIVGKCMYLSVCTHQIFLTPSAN
jgi:hypothetical protein